MIKSATLDFLKDLAKNNNREWFQDNKPRYEEAKENVIAFTGELLKELKKADPSFNADIEPKKCIMRIYRDIRFSLNKTPYKNNFGISKLLSGTKTDEIGYYVQIQPGNSFAGGGYWMPQAEHLKAIRQEIDYNASGLREIIDEPHFVKLFGDFRSQEQLKSIPRGYDANGENIDLLKLKSFAAIHQFTDEEIMKPNSPKLVAGVLGSIYPLTVFLNNAIA
ncbi:uncharacterized protein (TIGR02453 family) [Mucilaginibacter gracilis]|uniref:Uncharacterized protein (TIGR02453 family) n=1 Tax=Mucilaginibacter gracilis TaxID=423350 RepID=A0A495IXL1_9SPHI|nr:DUF2461 domain-containing protein [Mucilaginibacter gracilis]RKR81436.1 uncharacterized protein (TIGR02453 family) [Mucilaginibacter gracilis]